MEMAERFLPVRNDYELTLQRILSAELNQTTGAAPGKNQTLYGYDYVILDGPALLVTDAKVLATNADGTLVVFSAAETHRGTAQRILRELQSVHANTLGTVLMGVKTRKGGYFREFYRSYQDYQRVQLKQAY